MATLEHKTNQQVESLTDSVAHYKTKLVEAIELGFIKPIADATVRYAEAKAELDVWMGIQVWFTRGCVGENVKNQLLATLLRGADDSWSGRTNDIQRAAFDGTRRAIEKFMSWVE